MSQTLYTYYFLVFPREGLRSELVVRRLLQMFPDRAEMHTTTEGFEFFREEIRQAGFMLQDINRVPYLEPEPVP